MPTRIPYTEEPIRRTVRYREAAYPVQLVVVISARRALDARHGLAYVSRLLAGASDPPEGVIDTRKSRTIELIIPRWPAGGAV